MSDYIKEIGEADFPAEVEAAELPVFIDFWAPWCGPCKALAPLFEQLAGQYAGRIIFAKVNADDHPELARKLDVRGLPALLMFQDGKVVERTGGAQTRAHLSNLLDRYAGEAVSAASPSDRSGSALSAFRGDAALQREVVDRVDALVAARQIVPAVTLPEYDPATGRYSLMGAAAKAADLRSFEEALGIPAELGRLAEGVHNFAMRRSAGSGGDSDYVFEGPSARYPADWLKAITPGTNLDPVVPAFLSWLLLDLIDASRTSPADNARKAIETVADLHARSSRGDKTSAAEWQSARVAAGAAASDLQAIGGAPSFDWTLATVAETVAWPSEALDGAPNQALGLIFYARMQAAIRNAYSPEEWGEREALQAAVREWQTSHPGATQDEVEAAEPVRAFREKSKGWQVRDATASHDAKYAMGDDLHLGLVQALSAAVRPN